MMNCITAALVAAMLALAPALTPAVAAQQPDSTPGADTVEASAAAPVPVPEPTPVAVKRYRSGNVLWAVETLFGLAVPLLLLLTGFSARLRDLARRIGRRWLFTVAIYTVLLLVTLHLLWLPLDFYSEFVREHTYGLSNQTPGKWVGDNLKSLAVGCLIGTLTAWVPYLLLRRSPARWWIWTGLASLPFIVLALIVGPLYIDPLFNRFRPLGDQALERRVLALASRAGIEGSRVYEVEKSVDTKAIDAYVTGIGHSKRIVLYDTILRKLTPDEILFVVGHEIGHYVLGHVPRFVLVSWLLVVLSLYVVHRAARRLTARFGPRFGFTELSDVASMPLLLLLLSAVTLVASPLMLALSRHQEHEADRFGLELTRDNHAAATAFVKLAAENLDVPRPARWYLILRASHPPLAERIEFANRYRPWATGAPLEYGDRFARP
jgi:STE24 endopeptidase